MEAKIKKFDAVNESRKWKEAVGGETNGLTTEEVLRYFDRDTVAKRFNASLSSAKKKHGSS